MALITTRSTDKPPTTPDADRNTKKLIAFLAPYRNLPKVEFRALAAWASNFYPFQREWLFERADFAIGCKARQIGLSHSSAATGVIWGAFEGEATTIISTGQEEADEVLAKARRHVSVLQAIGSKNAETLRSNSHEIVFASGGSLTALPSSGGRGFTGNVILDEFGYQPHADAVWDAAAPQSLLGFKVRVLSTPNGVGNSFYDLWDLATNPERMAQIPKEMQGLAWRPHEIPINRAIAEGYPVDLARCWTTAKGDPRLFEQFFNCSFLDNVMQYVPNDVITLCRTAPMPIITPRGGEYYAGLDIGREADLSCLCVVWRAPSGQCVVVHVETMKRTDSDGLEAMVDRAFQKYNLTRLCIDETGIGSFPAERIKKKWSERIDVPHRRPRVDPITFTPNSKEAMATGLYTAMTGNVLKLPDSDRELPAFASGGNIANEAGSAKKLAIEISSIRRVISQSGNVLYTTPRTAEGHADRAWALMLAMHARSAVNPMIAALQERATGVKVIGA